MFLFAKKIFSESMIGTHVLLNELKSGWFPEVPDHLVKSSSNVPNNILLVEVKKILLLTEVYFLHNLTIIIIVIKYQTIPSPKNLSNHTEADL